MRLVRKKKILLGFCLLGGVSFLLFSYFRTRSQLLQTLSPEGQFVASEQEADEVLGGLSQVALLPDEKPTIATIVNAQTLREQDSFYSEVQNGDKLVLFTTVQRVYLYRPSQRKIINVGPLQLESQTNQEESVSQPDDAQKAAATLEVWNGTSRGGEANRVRDALREDGYTVIQTGNTRDDYVQNFVVLLGDSQHDEVAQLLAERLQAQKVSDIPEGESTSSADILIILGVPDALL